MKRALQSCLVSRIGARVRGIICTPWTWYCVSLLWFLALNVIAEGLLSTDCAVLAAFTTLLFLIIWILVALITRRWKRASLIACVGILSVALACLTDMFSEQIHFLILEPFYLAQIHREPKVTTKRWDWGGWIGFDTEVLYLKDERMLPEFVNGDDKCGDTATKVGAHFYIIDTVCK